MEIIGNPPKLAGLLCGAFICEGFVHKGKPVADANVVYLCFADIWHKLVLDCGVIIWRRPTEAPTPWSIDDLGYAYLHADVATLAGVVGRRLDDYQMQSDSVTAEVTFCFENGRAIIISNVNDQSTWRIA
jgi:hypothetical protein